MVGTAVSLPRGARIMIAGRWLMGNNIANMSDQEFEDYRKDILPEMEKEAARSFASLEILADQDGFDEPLGLAHGPIAGNGQMVLPALDAADEVRSEDE
ncbi:hypothetical protein V8J88_04470 [Massilia sp. W12]|uniref:hypothetical protein n=1 Tax=Massilia sp. W12 TaxID=3126507 RepID=UPI0030CC0712